MSIGRALGILVVAVLLDSVSSTSAPPLALRATAAAGLPADTFPTFDRVLFVIFP